MATITKRILIPIGDSHGVTLPKPWLQYNNLKAGDFLEVTEEYNIIHVKIFKDNGDKL